MNKLRSRQTSHRKLRSFRDVTRNVGRQRQQKRVPSKNVRSLTDRQRTLRKRQQLREKPYLTLDVVIDCWHQGSETSNCPTLAEADSPSDEVSRLGRLRDGGGHGMRGTMRKSWHLRNSPRDHTRGRC